MRATVAQRALYGKLGPVMFERTEEKFADFVPGAPCTRLWYECFHSDVDDEPRDKDDDEPYRDIGEYTTRFVVLCRVSSRGQCFEASVREKHGRHKDGQIDGRIKDILTELCEIAEVAIGPVAGDELEIGVKRCRRRDERDIQEREECKNHEHSPVSEKHGEIITPELLCAGRDSNPRSPKALGLQPSAFDRSATDACISILSNYAPLANLYRDNCRSDTDVFDYAPTAAFARAVAPRVRSGPLRTSKMNSMSFPPEADPPLADTSTITLPPSITPRAIIILAICVSILVCIRRLSGRAPYCGL